MLESCQCDHLRRPLIIGANCDDSWLANLIIKASLAVSGSSSKSFVQNNPPAAIKSTIYQMEERYHVRLSCASCLFGRAARSIAVNLTEDKDGTMGASCVRAGWKLRSLASLASLVTLEVHELARCWLVCCL